MIILIIVVSATQLFLFFYWRELKSKQKNGVAHRYNIQTRKDVWLVLNQTDLPDEDRIKLQKLYEEF